MTEADFSESLFSYIGSSFFDRNQAHLLFIRYDQDMDCRVNYREFCRLVVPRDKVLANILVGRAPMAERMTVET